MTHYFIHQNDGTNYSLFEDYCFTGNVLMAKQLLETCTTNNYVIGEDLFRNICESDYIEMVKFLLSFKDTHLIFDIHIDNDFIEYYDCRYYNRNTIKYLLSDEIAVKCGYNDKLKKLNPFILLCLYCFVSDFQKIKELLETEIIDIHQYDEFLLTFAIESNDFEVIKFLMSLKDSHGKINIHIEDEYLFHHYYENGNLDAIKFLLSDEIQDEYGPIIYRTYNKDDTSLWSRHLRFHNEIIYYLLSPEIIKKHGANLNIRITDELFLDTVGSYCWRFDMVFINIVKLLCTFDDRYDFIVSQDTIKPIIYTNEQLMKRVQERTLIFKPMIQKIAQMPDRLKTWFLDIDELQKINNTFAHCKVEEIKEPLLLIICKLEHYEDI